MGLQGPEEQMERNDRRADEEGGRYRRNRSVLHLRQGVSDRLHRHDNPHEVQIRLQTAETLLRRECLHAALSLVRLGVDGRFCPPLDHPALLCSQMGVAQEELSA